MYEKHEEPSCWDSKDGFCILASPDEQIRKFVVEGRWGDRLTYITTRESHLKSSSPISDFSLVHTYAAENQRPTSPEPTVNGLAAWVSVYF